MRHIDSVSWGADEALGGSRPGELARGDSSGRSRRRSRIGVTAPWWFALPALIVFIAIVVIPNIRGAVYAFTDWDGLSRQFEFIGFDNFLRIAQDSAAFGSVGNTLFLAFTITVVQNLLGLLLALGVNARVKSRFLLRVVFFAPAVLMPVAVSYLWKFMLTPQGAINSALSALGLDGLRQNWLGDPRAALWSIVIVVVWQFTGYSMVIFLANLQSVPQDLLEAAALDGAGPVKKFFHIVRPLLMPAIIINLMLSVIGGLKMFDQVMIVTGGGPAYATETLSTIVYKDAVQFSEFGYASALAIVLTVIVAVLSTLQYRVLNGRREK